MINLTEKERFIIEDLKSLFGDNIFNLAATMKSESEIDIEEEN